MAKQTPAFRFGCRRPGETGWTVHFALTAFNTAEGAEHLVKEWNRRDRGKLEWKCEPVLPTDIDYPGNYERHLRRLARQRKSKRRAAKDNGPDSVGDAFFRAVGR